MMPVALCLLLATGALADAGSSSRYILSAEEERLADMDLVEITTQEWSLKATESSAKSFKAPPGQTQKPSKAKIEAWVLGGENENDNECVEKQLRKSGYAPMRFSLIESDEFKHVKDGDARKKYKDCFAKGSLKTMTADDLAQWCSYKRFFEALESTKSDSDSSADYYLMVESAPVIHTDNFKPVVEDIIHNTQRGEKWSFIQIDPHGSLVKPAFMHRGMAAFEGEALKGSLATIVKKADLKTIVEKMGESHAMPMASFMQTFPDSFGISAGVAINPAIAESSFLAKAVDSSGAFSESEADKMASEVAPGKHEVQLRLSELDSCNRNWHRAPEVFAKAAEAKVDDESERVAPRSSLLKNLR